MGYTKIAPAEMDRRVDNIYKNIEGMSRERLVAGLKYYVESLMQMGSVYHDDVTLLDTCMWKEIKNPEGMAEIYRASRKAELEGYTVKEFKLLEGANTDEFIQDFCTQDDIFNKRNAFFKVFNFCPVGNISDAAKEMENTLLFATQHELEQLKREYSSC